MQLQEEHAKVAAVKEEKMASVQSDVRALQMQRRRMISPPQSTRC